MFKMRPYEPSRDARQVYALWQSALGHLWPLPYRIFEAVTTAIPAYQQGDHFVMVSDEQIVGWVATQLKQGVATIQLGGGFTYFWQGVPINLPAAWSFFQVCGWQDNERGFDLSRDMADYATPSWVYERLRAGITVVQAVPGDADAILAFEERHFPEWLFYFQRVLRYQRYADIVVAKDARQGIVGSALVEDPRSPLYDMRWTMLLGENTGGIGTLGVAESMREQGIGLALAARVSELLWQRRLEKSYLGWMWLIDWYGKLGYKVWQE